MPMMPGMPGGHDGHMPYHDLDEEVIWISTDVMTIMAAEDMPAFHFWFSEDLNGSLARFMVSYGMIAEFEDANGDEAIQFNETTHFAPLSAYDWSTQSGFVVDNQSQTTEVWLRYTKGGAKTDYDDHTSHMMPWMNDQPSIYHDGAEIDWFEGVTIQIWAHLYFQEYNSSIIDTDGEFTEYTIAGGTELKIDISIGNFPFSSETAQVAVQTQLHEDMSMNHMFQENHMFQTREYSHNVSFSSMMNWTTEYGNESLFENSPFTHMQQIDFFDTSTQQIQGFYKWLDIAELSWPGGDTEIVNVTSSYVPTGMGVSLFFSYPNFGNGSLLHDPSIGLIEGAGPFVGISSDTLIIGVIVIVSVIAIVLILFQRR